MGTTSNVLKSKGFILAVLANLLWGTSFYASKVTLKFWGPFTASVLRFTLAILAMLFVFPLFRKSIAIPKSRRLWGRILLIALSGFGLLYPLQLKGMTLISSSVSACIMLTSPLFVLLIATGMFKESLSNQKLVAIALGIVGGTFLISPGGLSSPVWNINGVSQLMIGIGLTLLASICLAVSVLATKSACKELDAYSLTFWSMTLGLFMLLPFALGEHQPLFPSESPYQALLALTYLGLICSVAAFLLWNLAISKTPPQALASTMHIKTPVAVLVGVAIANESITLPILIGTALISLAVWLSQQPSQILKLRRSS